MSNNLKLTIDVNRCARCSLDHAALVFQKFNIPIMEKDDIEWNYWAPCPSNGDPVLMRIIQVAETYLKVNS